eukprot:1176486-Rhodomonas_salina.1
MTPRGAATGCRRRVPGVRQVLTHRSSSASLQCLPPATPEAPRAARTLLSAPSPVLWSPGSGFWVWVLRHTCVVEVVGLSLCLFMCRAHCDGTTSNTVRCWGGFEGSGRNSESGRA